MARNPDIPASSMSVRTSRPEVSLRVGQQGLVLYELYELLCNRMTRKTDVPDVPTALFRCGTPTGTRFH